MKKKCIDCNLIKTAKEFYYRRDSKKFRAECKSCYSNKNRIRKHGVHAKEYQTMLESQNYVCAICKTRPEDILSVDHDHDTGNIRGLLCQKCNKGLGLFQDSLSNLRNAISYLEMASKA